MNTFHPYRYLMIVTAAIVCTRANFVLCYIFADERFERTFMCRKRQHHLCITHVDHLLHVVIQQIRANTTCVSAFAASMPATCLQRACHTDTQHSRIAACSAKNREQSHDTAHWLDC